MDIITAYSGGGFPSAIGIVRLSGEGTGALLNKIFRAKGEMIPRMMRYGEALGRDGKTIDLCMAAYFEEGHSYTGEEMAEIYCHGSQAVVEELLRAAQKAGARLAEAGEFTKRAFLNGKMDLTEAEAVGDLIHATALNQAKAAIDQLSGGIYKKVSYYYQKINALLAHFYAVCDYTDEDIEPFDYENARDTLIEVTDGLKALYETFELGSSVKNGLPCAIIGRPNSGKSSLLNAILGYERAIVTEEEGTTRDTVECTVQIKGTLLRLIDTAGIREGESKAERLGIERSIEAAKQAKLVLCVIDGSAPPTSDDFRSVGVAKDAEKSVLIINKTDKGIRYIDEYGFDTVFYVSAKTGEGIDELMKYLGSLVKYNDSETIITSARQAYLLEKAYDCLYEAEISARIGQTADAFLSDAEAGLAYLGDVLGKTPSKDMLDEIFSKFCVGK